MNWEIKDTCDLNSQGDGMGGTPGGGAVSERAKEEHSCVFEMGAPQTALNIRLKRGRIRI